MAKILCVYYSRTGHTAALMQEIAEALDCELVKIEDNIKRNGVLGWCKSGLHAMSRSVPPVQPLSTRYPLSQYDFVIIGTPVWAGRCSAPVRSFLRQYGEKIRRAGYLITRSSNIRYEEVFEQMDLYLRKPHLCAVSIRPDSIGSDFWKNEFLSAVYNQEEHTHAG